MAAFTARVIKIGINPCVIVPAKVLAELFAKAGKEKGRIPVNGRLEGKPFQQTIVRYLGKWRLYLNTQMRKEADVDVGDKVRMTIDFEPNPPQVPMPHALAAALARRPQARAAFLRLTPHRQKEIKRYIGSLKEEAARDRNVERVLRFLTGETRRAPSAFLRAA